MDSIHADIPEIATVTAGWVAAAPTQPSVHPICTPGTDPTSLEVVGALSSWPATHDALIAQRATQAGNLAAGNSGTEAHIGGAETSNVNLIEEIEA